MWALPDLGSNPGISPAEKTMPTALFLFSQKTPSLLGTEALFPNHPQLMKRIPHNMWFQYKHESSKMRVILESVGYSLKNYLLSLLEDCV